MSYTLEKLQSAMVDAALARWERVQKDYDPGQEATPTKIEQMVDVAGAGWDLGEDGEYTDESELDQCGYLVAASGREVGRYLEDDRCVDVALRRPVAALCLGSTARLHYAQWWEEAEAPDPERIPFEQIRRGDIVVVRTSGVHPYGDHITLARGPLEDGEVPAVEANATGRLGDGTTGEGLVVRTRKLEEIVVVYRLRIEHFTGEALREPE